MASLAEAAKAALTQRGVGGTRTPKAVTSASAQNGHWSPRQAARQPATPGRQSGPRGGANGTRSEKLAQSTGRSSKLDKYSSAWAQVDRGHDGVSRPQLSRKTSGARRQASLPVEAFRNPEFKGDGATQDAEALGVQRRVILPPEDIQIAGLEASGVEQDVPACGHVQGLEPKYQEPPKSAGDVLVAPPLPAAALVRAEEVGRPSRTPTLTPNALTDSALTKSEHLLANLLALDLGDENEPAPRGEDPLAEGDRSTRSAVSIASWPAWMSEDVETVKVPAHLLDKIAEVWALYRKLCRAAPTSRVRESSSAEPTATTSSPRLREPEPETASTSNGADSSDGAWTLGCSQVSTPAYPSTLSSPRTPGSPYPVGHARCADEPWLLQRALSQPWAARACDTATSLPAYPATGAYRLSSPQHASRRVASPFLAATRSRSCTAPTHRSQSRVVTCSAPSPQWACGVSIGTETCAIQQSVTITQTVKIPFASIWQP